MLSVMPLMCRILCCVEFVPVRQFLKYFSLLRPWLIYCWYFGLGLTLLSGKFVVGKKLLVFYPYQYPVNSIFINIKCIDKNASCKIMCSF